MNTESTVRDAIAAGKESLVKDLKTCGANADDLLKEATGATVRQVRCAVHATDGYVKGHPWAVLGVVAVAGLVIGSLLRRH